MMGVSEGQVACLSLLWCRLGLGWLLVVVLAWLEVCNVVLQSLHLLVFLAGHLDVVGVPFLRCLLACCYIHVDEFVHRAVLEGYLLDELWVLPDYVAEGCEVYLTEKVCLFHISRISWVVKILGFSR